MFFDLTVRDVTQRDQKILFEVGRQDLWRGTIRWSENPREWTDQAYQLFAQSSLGKFTLEDSFQAAVRAAPASVDADADGEWDPGTKGFIIKNGIAQGAQSVEVGHQRKVGGAAFEYTPSRHWILSIEGDRERRRGTAPRRSGCTSRRLPRRSRGPINFKTDLITAAAEYVGKSWNAGMRFAHTTFENGNPSLQWDDQLFLVDEAVNVNQANPGRMQMSQAVDFDSNQLWLFGSQSPRADADRRVRVVRQHEPGRPVPPDDHQHAPDGGAAPRIVLRRRAQEHDRAALGVFASDAELPVERLVPSLRPREQVALSWCSPTTSLRTISFRCAATSTCATPTATRLADDRIARRSLPYSFKRESIGALAGWAPIHWFNGSLSFERLRQDRDFSAVTRSDEDILEAHPGLRHHREADRTHHLAPPGANGRPLRRRVLRGVASRSASRPRPRPTRG